MLVVDDEPDIRRVVKMTLQKAGYEVLEAENGEKAIEVINSGEKPAPPRRRDLRHSDAKN